MNFSIKTKVGVPFRIGGDSGWFPSVKRWSDGTIVVGYTQAGHDFIGREEFMTLYEHFRSGGGFSNAEMSLKGLDDINTCAGFRAVLSRDGGMSWNIVRNDIYSAFLGTMFELRDGTLIANYINSLNPEGRQELIIYRSCDKGETFEGPEFVPMIGPPQADPSWGGGFMGGSYYGGLIEEDDGALLLFGHTYFEGDKKCRVVVYRSTDGAKSFSFLSTAAYEVCVVPMAIPGGFCEPGAVRLKSGELICFLRTTEYEPMFQVRSADGGLTWSEPVPVGVDGILPTPVLMSNGVLALGYGAPGMWLNFSPDGVGKRWTGKTCVWIWNSLIEEGHVPQARHYLYNIPDELIPKDESKASSYRSGCRVLERSDCNLRIAEISPGRLLAVYGAPIDASDLTAYNPIDSDQRKDFCIWGVTIDVELT